MSDDRQRLIPVGNGEGRLVMGIKMVLDGMIRKGYRNWNKMIIKTVYINRKRKIQI